MRPSDLCRKASCFPMQIARLLSGDDPLLEPFAGGYRLCGDVGPTVDEREAEIALRLPGAVLYGIGAARKWDLTDLTRDQARDTVLVPLGAWHEAGRLESIEFRRTGNARLLMVGVISEEIVPGLSLRVTGPERTVCDLFASEVTSGMVAVEALSRFLSEEIDLDAACSRILMVAAQMGRDRAMDRLDLAIQAAKGATQWIGRL